MGLRSRLGYGLAFAVGCFGLMSVDNSRPKRGFARLYRESGVRVCMDYCTTLGKGYAMPPDGVAQGLRYENAEQVSFQEANF